MYLQLHRLLDATLDYIKENEWAGACYASTAILYILLKEAGIEATPTLGVFHARTPNAAGFLEDSSWDHAWIEINGDIYDVALTLGIVKNFDTNFLPSYGIRGSHGPHFNYAKDEAIDQINADSLFPFYDFMSNSPCFDRSIDYWDICVQIGLNAGLILDKFSLMTEYQESNWEYKYLKGF